MFETLLVANRGEIACRVIGTARRLGIRTVAVYSDADAEALHTELADEAVRIGAPPPAESYLRIDALVEAARSRGAEALHPGYGFLAESPELAEACAAAGLAFVGPPAGAIRAMGDKAAALARMAAAGVPVLPGYRDAAQDDEALARAAAAIGYPLLVKPVAGGGGKGMRVVREAGELGTALGAARREAEGAFGDARLLLERYLEPARHVEVQVFADAHGHCHALLDRDCSLQRRHQKVIEEAPAPGLDEAAHAALAAAAVRAARAIDYRGAGTVEFLLEPGGGFYFMEMNTRLQVEHPVTEMITGIDLVEWQLRVAAGEPLPEAWSGLRADGHAVEARIYAEDPARGFLPVAGRLRHLRLPEPGGGVRVDTGVRQGDEVSAHYDPMIAKLVAHGSSRRAALRRLRRALEATEVVGVPTNVAFLEGLLRDPEVTAGPVDTGLIERRAAPPEAGSVPDRDSLLLAALYLVLARARERREAGRRSGDPCSPWHHLHDWRLGRGEGERLTLEGGGETDEIVVRRDGEGYRLAIGAAEVAAGGVLDPDGTLHATLDGSRVRARVVEGEEGELWVMRGHRRTCLRRPAADEGAGEDPEAAGRLRAPMPGRVVAVEVTAGQPVRRGEPLLVLEAMKMEHTLSAPFDGVIERLACAPGDTVREGLELVVVSPRS